MKLARISKQICSAVCVLALALSSVPAAVAVEKTSYKKSGDLSAVKMTQGQIAALLDEAPLTTTALADTFVETPSVVAPYKAGKVATKVLQDTTNRLNALRALAGLPAVTLNSAWCENAQYGAVLLAASAFSHFPAQPADMDKDFYDQGLDATSSSNIAAGRSLIYTPDAFMDDSDPSNIAVLGHRRWQLNPTLGKVGFGYVFKRNDPKLYYSYAVEKVIDFSGKGCDYEFIAWPASGNFPATDSGKAIFGTGTAWSITLNPDQYSTRNLASQNITVTLVRESDGKTWTFSNSQKDGFFNVDTDNYGVSNCIVFRPNNVGSTYSGLYTVRVSGLTDTRGNPVTDFAYQVNFFDTDNVTPVCSHTQTTVYPAVPSTCTTQGHAAYTKCDLCGEILSGSDALLPLAAHQYGALVAEQPASCTAPGVAAHYQCAVCKTYFDVNKYPTTFAALALPALGHSWSGWQSDATNHWKVCTVCSAVAEKAAHSWSWVVDQPATEMATGLKHQVCTVCGAKQNEGTVIDKLEHQHVGIQHHAALPATCHSEGTVEYWTCASPLCAGKYYADESCSALLTTIVAPVNPANHDGGTEQKGAVAATCTLDGKEADTYCLGCGAKIADGKVLPALGHDFEVQKWDEEGHWLVCRRCGEAEPKQPHTGGTASCSAPALCAVCGASYGAPDPSVHLHIELRDAVEPTESREGYTGDTWCTDCNKLVKTGEVLPKLTHQLTFHPAKASTCAQQGNLAYWSCSNPECNGKYYADEDGTTELESVLLPLDPESHLGPQGMLAAKEPSCTQEGYSGDVYCTACNTILEKGHSIAALGHQYQNGVCVLCGQRDPSLPTTDPNQTPTEGDGQNTSGNNQTATPQTGEGSEIFYLGTLLAVSVAALGGMLVFRRKKKTVDRD